MSNARCAGDTSEEICRGDVCPVSSVQCPPTPDYSHEGGGTSDHQIITSSHTINQFDFSAPRDCSHQCKSNLSADGCFLNFPQKISQHFPKYDKYLGSRPIGRQQLPSTQSNGTLWMGVLAACVSLSLPLTLMGSNIRLHLATEQFCTKFEQIIDIL